MYKFVLYISDIISALKICSSVLFLCIPHVSDIIWYLLFYSDLLYSVWQSLSQSTKKIDQWEDRKSKDTSKHVGSWFSDQGSTSCPLQWKPESQLLKCQGNLPNSIWNSTLVFECVCIWFWTKQAIQSPYGCCLLQRKTRPSFSHAVISSLVSLASKR